MKNGGFGFSLASNIEEIVWTSLGSSENQTALRRSLIHAREGPSKLLSQTKVNRQKYGRMKENRVYRGRVLEHWLSTCEQCHAPEQPPACSSARPRLMVVWLSRIPYACGHAPSSHLVTPAYDQSLPAHGDNFKGPFRELKIF